MKESHLRYGMVGGGPGAFIGEVHRRAARLDDKVKLVAGSFSREYEKTLTTGRELGMDEDRLYDNFQDMAAREAEREDGIDFVSITTPNHTHHKIAKAFLEKGINVLCDKPVTTTVAEAEELQEIAVRNEALFCVSYTYSGYPMVKEARHLIEEGELGEIRVIMGEYPQEWLAEPADNKQASWRTNPDQAGISNCMGDIGSHIEHTVSYMTGCEIKKLSANLDIFVEGRKLDDNGEVMVKYEDGVSGMYWASQVAIGHDNGLKIRVYGSKGSLEWEQENPNYLKFTRLNQAPRILSRGHEYLGETAQANTRVPAGHPEGYIEAFANIYSNFAAAVQAKKEQGSIDPAEFDYPKLEEGLRGVKFVKKCVESSRKDSKWMDFN
ncbi:MAG: Gfo/Idh/MocA family protein [Bacillota bacterium]